MKTRILLICLGVLSMGLVGCNTQSKGVDQAEVEVVLTSVIQTVTAQNHATTPTPTRTQTSTFSVTSQESAVSEKSPTPTRASVSICDNASYIDDITIPDGTILFPGEEFTKTWELKNTGTCSWQDSYSLGFISGSLTEGQIEVLEDTVSPGGSTHVSVSLIAPSSTGTYSGQWRMHTSSGSAFGESLYLAIEVSEDAATLTPTPLLTEMPEATLIEATAVATNTPVETEVTSTPVSPTATTAVEETSTAVPPTEIPTEPTSTSEETSVPQSTPTRMVPSTSTPAPTDTPAEE